jgi:cytochrome c1
MVFGLITLPKVMAHEHHADILVNVKGIQWTWLVDYPDQQVSGAREIVLPVDRTVKFDVTSGDVLHSFWIPAFLMKIDRSRPHDEHHAEADEDGHFQSDATFGSSARSPARATAHAPSRSKAREVDEWPAGACAGLNAVRPTTDQIAAKNVGFDLGDDHPAAARSSHPPRTWRHAQLGAAMTERCGSGRGAIATSWRRAHYVNLTSRSRRVLLAAMSTHQP